MEILSEMDGYLKKSASSKDTRSKDQTIPSSTALNDTGATISQDQTDGGEVLKPYVDEEASTDSETTNETDDELKNKRHRRLLEDRMLQMLQEQFVKDGQDESTQAKGSKLHVDEMKKLELVGQIREKLASIPEISLPEQGPESQLIQYLIASVARLGLENSMLQGELAAQRKMAAESREPNRHSIQRSSAKVDKQIVPYGPHNSEISHTKYGYLDAPRMFKGDSKFDHIRGLEGIENIAKYMERHQDMAFAVIDTYECRCRYNPAFGLAGYKDGKLLDDSPIAEKNDQLTNIHLASRTRNAIQSLMESYPDHFQGFSKTGLPECFYSPFLFFYHYNKLLLEILDSDDLTQADRDNLETLCKWFEMNCRKDWDEANVLFSRGKVNAQHYTKLFHPVELIVHETDGLLQVHKSGPYPWSDDQERSDKKYDGLSERDGEVNITSLAKYPMRFADKGLRKKLVARGQKFWECRKRKLVSYIDPNGSEEDLDKRVDYRYMVDYDMFRKMHPSNPMFSNMKDDLGHAAFNSPDPPDDDFLALLPPQIHAFDVNLKAWKVINVDHVTDVTWNKDAFSQLVVPDETKELIQAAITAHGHQFSVARDIIAGKGQGLLILLHGGPGTGKTLTAESIAEAQERPLYRVTCGDVGIEPLDVEKYLQTALAIGKAWGCVVLLDEADVFLEERNVADQRQNAVASVFLRLLEYYDGILILTTNRVGTFDEAFKSRIHLAIRYPSLDEEQRLGVWHNFIQLLDHSKERVDVDDLELNINKLARVELNGRQIRNVITLARYLAKFRKQMLMYKHVQDALASVVKFDEYLLKVRGPDDRWARESQLR